MRAKGKITYLSLASMLCTRCVFSARRWHCWQPKRVRGTGRVGARVFLLLFSRCLLLHSGIPQHIFRWLPTASAAGFHVKERPPSFYYFYFRFLFLFELKFLLLSLKIFILLIINIDLSKNSNPPSKFATK